MMKSILLIVPFLVMFTAFGLQAQPSFTEEGPVFSDESIPRIDILIDEDSLQAIFDDVESYHEYPATFIFSSPIITDTVEQIGFRIRGNTSRWSAKKSFKISFNTFERGRKFYGLEKMNINGEHNDPSVIRAKLCWDMLRKMEIPASRSNHVELYINGNYYGLYINVEHIDEEFVLARFGNRDGNLYKCLWPADLDYISRNPEDYKFETGDRRTYDLRTNTSGDNYHDLTHLIDILNNTPDEEFACEIEKVFNVDDFLKVMAFDVLTGNWDDYSYLNNNYYLYHNTATGKFEFIPYDLDNTFGIDWIGRDWAIRDIYNWANRNEPRPLYTRLMDIQKYRDQYSYYIDRLITGILDPVISTPRIDSIHSMITPSLETDPYYPLTYGYTIDDFHRSYDLELGGHVIWGLKPFIRTRITSARAMLETKNIIPVIKYIRSNHPRLGEPLVFSAFILDDDPGITAEVVYSVNDGSAESRAMKDDGIAPDPVAGDNIYTVSFEPLATAASIRLQVRASSAAGNALEPCEAIEILIFESDSPDLVINEFMAGNVMTRTDKYGEFDDWVEIYNRDTKPVWLGDKYLSDDLNNPSRWKLPDHTLNPSDFVLVWTDGQNGQGLFHASFRLSRSGEEIGIFESPERNSDMIDHLVFGLQQDDHSYGRITDGGMDWISFLTTTPGYSNLSTADITTDETERSIKAYPNPAAGDLIFFNRISSARLYDISGRIMGEMSNSREIYIGNLPAGIYIVRFSGGETIRVLIQ